MKDINYLESGVKYNSLDWLFREKVCFSLTFSSRQLYFTFRVSARVFIYIYCCLFALFIFFPQEIKRSAFLDLVKSNFFC